MGDVLLASSINASTNMVRMIRNPHNTGRKTVTEMTCKSRSEDTAVRGKDLGSEGIELFHSCASLTGKFSFLISKGRLVALIVSKVP